MSRSHFAISAALSQQLEAGAAATGSSQMAVCTSVCVCVRGRRYDDYIRLCWQWRVVGERLLECLYHTFNQFIAYQANQSHLHSLRNVPSTSPSSARSHFANLLGSYPPAFGHERLGILNEIYIQIGNISI